MSLKAFHIFFIAVSILLTLGFSILGIYVFVTEQQYTYLIMGIGSLASGVALIIYGVQFVKKLKNISYL